MLSGCPGYIPREMAQSCLPATSKCHSFGKRILQLVKRSPSWTWWVLTQQLVSLQEQKKRNTCREEGRDHGGDTGVTRPQAKVTRTVGHQQPGEAGDDSSLCLGCTLAWLSPRVQTSSSRTERNVYSRW